MESQRKLVWTVWAINELVALAFGLVSLGLWHEIDTLQRRVTFSEGDFSSGLLMGIAATAVIVCVLVALWTALSAAVMLRATLPGRNRSRSYSYAFLLAVGWWTAFHLAHAAVHLHSVKGFCDVLADNLPEGTKFEIALVWAGILMGYISSGFFVFTILVLTFMRQGVQPGGAAGGASFNENNDASFNENNTYDSRAAMAPPAEQGGGGAYHVDENAFGDSGISGPL